MDREAVENCMLTYNDGDVTAKKVASKGGGLGVFALRLLPPGLDIGDYIGELIGSQEVRKRPTDGLNDGNFRFELGDDTGLYIDPLDANGRCKYISHVHYINEPSPGEVCNCAFFADTVSSRMYIRTVSSIEPGFRISTMEPEHENPINRIINPIKPWPLSGRSLYIQSQRLNLLVML